MTLVGKFEFECGVFSGVMKKHGLLVSVAVSVLFGTSVFSGAGLAGEPKWKEPPPPDVTRFAISGRICDLRGEPVKDCQVRIWNHEGTVTLETLSKKDGEFSIPHDECGSLTLEVLPPEKLPFAQTLMEKLPGNVNRKVIVRLNRGYLVSGRVVAKGKGLKGLVVKVEPLEKGPDGKVLVHGHGGCVTGKNGVFSLRLTEGKKRLTVVNDQFTDLSRIAVKEFVVSEDTHLGALELH